MIAEAGQGIAEHRGDHVAVIDAGAAIELQFFDPPDRMAVVPVTPRRALAIAEALIRAARSRLGD